MAEKLTDAKIQALPIPEKGQPEYADAVVPGLRVRVGAGGTKTFMLRKRVAGKPINQTIGKWHPVRFNVNDARRVARAALSDLDARGIVRPKQKISTAPNLTIRKMLPDYIAYVRDEKRNRGWQETERVFNRLILPLLGDRLADTVTRGDISRMIDAIPNQSAKRAAFSAVSAYYTWAMRRLDNLLAHPARNAGKPGAPVSRERVLSDLELRALWLAADAEPYPWRAAVKMLMLTGTRRDEVFAADRAEFDLEDRLWTIPGSRSKNGVEHLVPLSDPMIAIVSSVPHIGDSPKLFPAQRGGTGHASGYSKLATRLRESVASEIDSPVPNWRLHDVRRTFVTAMQKAHVRFEVIEALVNHVSGTKGGVAGVYQRYDRLDEKRSALAEWAGRLAEIVGKELRP